MYVVPSCITPRITMIPPQFQGAREGFRASTLRHFLPVDRDSFGSVTRSTYAVRCTIEPVDMRLAACLSGIRGSI